MLHVNACQLPYHMIKLEISVIPKSIKRIEFAQSLSSLDGDLLRCCPNLIIAFENDIYRITAEFKTKEQLKKVLAGKEFGILAGAIKTLGKKSDINIHGVKYKKRGPNLRDIEISQHK